MGKLYSALLGIPKTIWFNFRYLPIKQAIKLPFIFAGNVRFRKLSGIVKIIDEKNITTGMIRIGFHCVEPLDTYGIHTILSIESDGKMIFKGTAHIGRGAILHVAGGTLTMGDNFAISGSTSIVCKNNISIGDDVQFSYNGLVMDSDAHKIFDISGREYPNTSPIIIGNKVWIAPNVTIQKGSEIASNTVVASNSLVNRKFYDEGAIIGGIPCRILKKIKGWEL